MLTQFWAQMVVCFGKMCVSTPKRKELEGQAREGDGPGEGRQGMWRRGNMERAGGLV